MRLALITLLALAGCAHNKTWQEACFEPIETNASSGFSLMGAKRPTHYNPVLKIERRGNQRVIVCE